MATVELTKDNFAETIENNEIVLIDFWASWCEPCKTFEPIFKEASEKHAEITFGTVDTDAEPEIAGAFNIQSIPTFMVFRDQIGLLSQPGVLSESALDSVIEQVKGLDMDEVRAQIAEHQAEHGEGCGCGNSEEN